MPPSAGTTSSAALTHQWIALFRGKIPCLEGRSANLHNRTGSQSDRAPLPGRAGAAGPVPRAAASQGTDKCSPARSTRDPQISATLSAPAAIADDDVVDSLPPASLDRILDIARDRPARSRRRHRIFQRRNARACLPRQRLGHRKAVIAAANKRGRARQPPGFGPQTQQQARQPAGHASPAHAASAPAVTQDRASPAGTRKISRTARCAKLPSKSRKARKTACVPRCAARSPVNAGTSQRCGKQQQTGRPRPAA